jgi:hypothetical protein
MKVQDLFLEDDGEDDDFPTAKLKVLSKHVYHGRAFVRRSEADAALNAVTEGGDADVILWHDWMHGSDMTYELSLTSLTKDGITSNLDAIKKAVPRAHLSIAYKSGMIDHGDWKDYSGSST